MTFAKKLFSGLLLISLLITLSCSVKPFYEEVTKFKNATWDRFTIKIFTFPIQEEGKTYSISLKLKTDSTFLYEEFPVYVILTTPGGEERMRDVILKAAKNSTSASNENTTLLWKEITIADKGICKISIENQIPKIETSGVEELKIVVTENK